MSQKISYPDGAPCWVETLQPDQHAAMDFYGRLFGWEFRPAEADSDNDDGGHFTATLDGQQVAGIRSAASMAEQPVPPMWSTSVLTRNIDTAADDAVRAGGSVLLGPVAVAGDRWGDADGPDRGRHWAAGSRRASRCGAAQ